MVQVLEPTYDLDPCDMQESMEDVSEQGLQFLGASPPAILVNWILQTFFLLCHDLNWSFLEDFS